MSEKSLKPIVIEIFERREYATCWFNADTDCANWTGCHSSCPLVRLREMAGIEPREDGEIFPPHADREEYEN